MTRDHYLDHADDPAVARAAHRYLGTQPGATGYLAACRCGWVSAEHPTRRAAQGACAGHIGNAIAHPHPYDTDA